MKKKPADKLALKVPKKKRATAKKSPSQAGTVRRKRTSGPTPRQNQASSDNLDYDEILMQLKEQQSETRVTLANVMNLAMDQKVEDLDDLLVFLRKGGIRIIDEIEEIKAQQIVDQEVKDEDITGLSSLQFYFNELKKMPPMSAKVEREFTSALQIAKDAVVALIKKTKLPAEFTVKLLEVSQEDVAARLKTSKLSASQQRKFMEKFIAEQKKYLQCRVKLIEGNLRLVIMIAKKYINCGLPFSDLINEGNLGLMQALLKYDPNRGFRVCTYSAWWIRQSILKAISSKSRTIRIPIYMSIKMQQIQRIYHQLSQASGRAPTTDELCVAADMRPEQLKIIFYHLQTTASLDSPVGPDFETDLLDMVSTREGGVNTLKELNLQFMGEEIQNSLAQLSDRERDIVEWRYGLNDKEELTLEEIGRLMGITRERVRQLEIKALEKIKRSNFGLELKEFLFNEEDI